MGKGSLGKAFLKIMKRMLTALATSCSQAFRSSGYWALCAKPCSRTMMIEIHFHAEYTCYLLWAHWDLSSNSWLVWFVGSFEMLLAMAKFRSVSQSNNCLLNLNSFTIRLNLEQLIHCLFKVWICEAILGKSFICDWCLGPSLLFMMG